MVGSPLETCARYASKQPYSRLQLPAGSLLSHSCVVPHLETQPRSLSNTNPAIPALHIRLGYIHNLRRTPTRVHKVRVHAEDQASVILH